ncbi:MAG: agmatinase family protein [Pseudomonadota bacterium]
MNLTQFTVIGLAITACITATKVHAKAGVNAEKDTPFVANVAGQVPTNIDSATPGMMALKPLEIPQNVQVIIDKLPEQKQAFIKSGKTNAVLSKSRLFDLLLDAPEDEVQNYVDTIISVYDQIQFKAGRDTESIELNKDSADFNTWRLKRPQSMNPEREAGPISLGRYIGGGRSGIPTFANAPVALTPEDLIAGKVDVAILGAPLDMGSGWRDAIHGPRAMRMLRSGTGGTDVSTMVTPSAELNIVDYGNVAIDQLSTERSVQEVRSVVREIAQTGAIPIIIGGDHSLEYPNVAAIADVYGKGKVSVVHFDAHLDTGRGRVHLLSHGQPIYRLMKEAHIKPENFIQVGLRAHYSKSYYEWEKEIGMKYHTMAEVERRGWDAVMNRVIKEATENTEYLYVSFDVDVLDPAFQPGTGTPVSGGLTMREAIPILRRLCAETKLVGFDIVELAPALDTTYVSALNANSLMYACMTGIAMKKKGITEKGFISELSSEHGQDDYYGDKK